MPAGEKHTYKYEPAVPIPTYDEATSSTHAQNLDSPYQNEYTEPSDRVALLMGDDFTPHALPTRRLGYRPPLTPDYAPPTVEDVVDEDDERDSLDVLDLQDGALLRRTSTSSESRQVRREIEEMDFLDPVDESVESSSTWGKRIGSISSRLKSSLPTTFSFSIPKLRIPKLDPEMFLFCVRLLGVMFVAAVMYVLFVSDAFAGAATRMAGTMFDPESVRVFVQDQVNAETIKTYLQHVTSYDHVAGTEGNYALGRWVEGMFATAGLEQVGLDEYQVYLNYPKEGGRAVELLKDDGSVAWQARIEEDRVYEDRTQTMVFHGHSKSGDVKGPLIFANYGSREDYKRLYDSGIETKGAIALVKYYGTQGDRALKIKAAEDVGFAGCIIYSDPMDDGTVKGDVWPKGRFMPEDGVQRGGVSMMSWIVGDPLTPGWPSKLGQLRLQPSDSKGLVKIPSIPLSWRDAKPLLEALKGFGYAAPDEWLGTPDVELWTGNQSSPIVHLKNEQDEITQQPIWNVMGKIIGVEQKEKRVIVGNHRDAWTFGAVDPGSGTAIMMEVVRIFGMLVERGWRPLRTIEFASWDAEEYNLVGSTEYVEDNMKILRRDGYAYINLDSPVGFGNDFHASASPVFKKALLRVLDRTSDPSTNSTMRKSWDDRRGELEGLGAGSDYVAFQDLAGISSIDLAFTGSEYPYHSVYDNFEWMCKFGDPDFSKHQVMAQMVALLILEIADKPILPFDMEAYSAAITQYTLTLTHWSENKGANMDGNPSFSMTPLEDAVLDLAKNVQQHSKFENDWTTNVYATGGFETASWGAKRLSRNDRMAEFDKNLLDLEPGGGLKDRDQFKHILFAPQLWSGYEEAFFPAIRDAIDAKDWALAQANVDKAARMIRKAGEELLKL